MANELENNPRLVMSDKEFVQMADSAYSSAKKKRYGKSGATRLSTSYMDYYIQMLMNYQNQEFAKEQSELAYERSTVSAQLQQFIDAGFSPQQAMSIIQGNGSAGEYTPADASATASTMADYGAALSADQAQKQFVMDSMMNAVNLSSQFGSAMSQMLSASDGGSIGAMVADPFIGKLDRVLSQIPNEYRSVAGLHALLNSDKCPEAFKQIATGSDWNRVNSLAGRKFLNAYLAQSVQFNTDTTRLTGLDIQNSVARVNLLRQKVGLSMDDVELRNLQLQQMKSTLDLDYQMKVSNSQIEAAIAMNQSQIEKYTNDSLEAQLMRQNLQNPEYRNAYLAHMLKDEVNAALVATALEKKLTAQLDWINDPANAQAMGILEYYQSVGFTSNNIGQLIAAMEAAGIPLNAGVRKIVDLGKSHFF